MGIAMVAVVFILLASGLVLSSVLLSGRISRTTECLPQMPQVGNPAGDQHAAL